MNEERIENVVDVVEEDLIEDFDFEENEPVKKSIFDKIKDGVNNGIDKVKEGAEWVKQNPEDALNAAVGAATIIGTGALVVLSIQKADEQAKTVYDKRTGETVILNKKLKNADKVEVDYRMANGQTKIQALNDMGLVNKKK